MPFFSFPFLSFLSFSFIPSHFISLTFYSILFPPLLFLPFPFSYYSSFSFLCMALFLYPFFFLISFPIPCFLFLAVLFFLFLPPCISLIGQPTTSLAGMTLLLIIDENIIVLYLFFLFSNKIGNLTSSCNAACSCNAVQYAPVCGVDKVSYFAPCHAGCHFRKDVHVSKQQWVFLVKNNRGCCPHRF